MRRLVFGTLLLMIVGATGIAVDYMNQWRLQNYAQGAVTPETYLAALPSRIETVTGDVSQIGLGGGETIGSYVDDFKATLAMNETGVQENTSASGFSNRDISRRVKSGELSADGLLGANADDLGDISPDYMYRYTKRNLMLAGLSEQEAELKAREAAKGLEQMMKLESTSD
jgi:hypothetical protein